MTSSHFTARVYYEDTDFSGNVYHAAYLHFFERARTEFLRERGVHHSELVKDGIAFAVRTMSIDFKAAVASKVRVRLRCIGISPLLLVNLRTDSRRTGLADKRRSGEGVAMRRSAAITQTRGIALLTLA